MLRRTRKPLGGEARAFAFLGGGGLIALVTPFRKSRQCLASVFSFSHLGRSRQSSPLEPNKAIAPSWSFSLFSRSTQASSKGFSARLAVRPKHCLRTSHAKQHAVACISRGISSSNSDCGEVPARRIYRSSRSEAHHAEQSSTHLRQAIYCYRNCAQIVHGQNQLKPEFRCKCQAIGGVWKSLEGVRPGNSKTTLLLNASILWRFRRTRNPLMIIWKSTAKGSSSQSAR